MVLLFATYNLHNFVKPSLSKSHLSFCVCISFALRVVFMSYFWFPCFPKTRWCPRFNGYHEHGEEVVHEE